MLGLLLFSTFRYNYAKFFHRRRKRFITTKINGISELATLFYKTKYVFLDHSTLPWQASLPHRSHGIEKEKTSPYEQDDLFLFQ